MHNILQLTLIVVFFTTLCLGHDSMILPVSRNGGVPQDSATPCDSTKKETPLDIQSGKQIQVEWGNAHEQGTYDITIAPAAQDTQVTAFKSLAAVAATTTQPQSTYVTIPNNVGLGLFTLRWSWLFNGGLYANCVDLRVTGVPPSQAEGTGGGTSPVDSQPLTSYQYILVNNKKSVGVYDSYTGSVTCIKGYKVKDGQCVSSSSMTPGGQAALAFFFIFLIIGSVCGAIYYVKVKRPIMYATWKAKIFKSATEAKGGPSRRSGV